MERDNNLLKIMVKALSPDPDQRFASAKEFLDAIEERTEVSSAPISMTTISKAEQESQMKPKTGNGFADVAGMEP